MKIITSIIQFLLILLVGTPKNNKARLGKKENDVSPFLNKIEMNLEVWVLRHAHILLPICLIILMILFVFVCYLIIGVSATDSGLQYNHLQDVI